MLGLGVLLAWTTLLPLSLRVRPDCLTLAASCCYLLNALNSRPDSFNYWRQLLAVIYPLVPGPGGHGVVAFQQGKTTWLHHVTLDGGPAGLSLPRVFRPASERVLCDIFKVGSLQELEDKNDIARKRRNPTWEDGDAPPTRHNNRQRLVTATADSVPAPDDVRAADRISLASVANALSEYTLAEAEAEVNRIWNCLPSELVQKSPTQRGGASWMHDPRQHATHALFKVPAGDLGTIFRATQIRLWDSMPRAEQWRVWTTCFEKCFPVDNRDATKNQGGYPTMQYHAAWMRFSKTQSYAVRVEIRKQIMRQFDRYAWFPSAQQDKPWPTGWWSVPVVGKPYSGPAVPPDVVRLGVRIMTRPLGRRPAHEGLP